MRFTVERAALVKMLQLVGKKAPNQKGRDKQVRLYACAARIFVEANQCTAGVEALVFADGGCVLAHDTFLGLLKSYASKTNVTMEADERTIRFFSSTLPVTSYSTAVSPPGAFTVFPVTDLDVLLPKQPDPEKEAEALSLHAAPSAGQKSIEAIQNQMAAEEIANNPPLFYSQQNAPNLACNENGCFPIAEDEMFLIGELVRLTRRLCALPTTKPRLLSALANSLFALEHLPRITKGVAVEFSVGIRWGTGNENTENWMTVQVSENWLIVGSMVWTRDPEVGGDNHTTAIYEVQSGGFRSMRAGDEESWIQIYDWIARFDSLIDENRPEELRFFSQDDSKPGFMDPNDEK